MFFLPVKLSQTYQHCLQTDVSAFSSLFKLTNQCAHHCCNYGENQIQPSSSLVRLLQPNHRPLPHSLSFNTVHRMPARLLLFFFPIRPNCLAIPQVVWSGRLSSCLLRLSPPDLRTGWQVCVALYNAVQCTRLEEQSLWLRAALLGVVGGNLEAREVER